MSHIVIHPGPDGKPGYHPADDLDEAIRLVEQLRNQHGVAEARIFRLEEVDFEYRPYFRVQVDDQVEAGHPDRDGPSDARLGLFGR